MRWCTQTKGEPTLPGSYGAAASGLLGLFLLVSFSSCLTPRKMDKWVDQHYGSTVPAKVRNNDFITVKTDNIKRTDAVSTTVKGKKKLIPALLYWHWDYSVVSTLNPYIPVSHFSSTVLPYAHTRGLRQKLGGQKVEFTIESAPASFEFTQKGHLIYVLVYYIGWEHIYIDPKKTDLAVSYRVLDGERETKSGVIHITNRDQPISLKIFQSSKKMTGRYLEQYNNNLKAMSRELVDKLLVELQAGESVVQAGEVK